MKRSVSFSEIRGKVRAPASKSALQRLIALSWLSGGETKILYPDYCNDVVSSLGIVQSLGAEVTRGKSSVTISSKDAVKRKYQAGEIRMLDCGESGLAIRMFSPIVSLLEGTFLLTASGSLERRPAGIITETLASFGLDISDNGGYPPVRITGPLKGGDAAVDGSISSQILTGLLLALPAAANDSVIRVNDLKSRPYVDMTIELASLFGCVIENKDYEVFTVRGGQSYSSPGTVAAEGDWSSASFLLVAGALSRGGEVRVENLKADSNQADRALLGVLRQCGAKIVSGSDFVEVKGEKQLLRAFEFDASDCPDLFPPLVSLAAGCSGTSVIHGAERLRHKAGLR